MQTIAYLHSAGGLPGGSAFWHRAISRVPYYNCSGLSMIRLGKAFGLTYLSFMGLILGLAGCGGESQLVSLEQPLNPADSLPPADPPDSPSDTTPPGPQPDTTSPPPPPSDTTGPSQPRHQGISFGPFVYTESESERSIIPPPTLSPAFTAVVAVAYLPTLATQLKEARRTNSRLLLSFAGAAEHIRDSKGFNLALWKQRVDRVRGLDLSSYIADGTILGHFIMDEPTDPSNWNGRPVSQSDIAEMARYSKEIWPELPTIIRVWPDYLEGHDFKHLDAAWVQYHVRFGSIDEFIATKVREAKELGIELVTGLNVLAGGGKDEGLPGYQGDRYAMNASQLRSWGNRLLAEPYFCAFFMWRFYPDNYFSRPDIQDVVAELSRKAQSQPKKTCRRQ